MEDSMKPYSRQLFTEKEMGDRSIYALSPTDSTIRVLSKRFAKDTVLGGTPENLMAAYQQGAMAMKDPIVEIICGHCPLPSHCRKQKDCSNCELMQRILKLFER